MRWVYSTPFELWAIGQREGRNGWAQRTAAPAPTQPRTQRGPRRSPAGAPRRKEPR